MEIKDMEGNVVSTITPGKSKGINIVNWQGRMKNPKVAKGKTFSFGGFTSPRVTAGTYKAVITKGRDSFEHNFEVVYDDRTGLSASDRKLKHDTTMKLYDMTQELAYMVYKLDAILESPSVKDKVKTSLNSLNETLVVTSGDNYVGTAEPQLREKMANLYSKVATSYDKPSNNELENLKIIQKRFDNAKADFAKLEKKIKDLDFKTFEEFLEE